MSALRVHLNLGRVSNLPTVWSNVLAGAVLSGAALGGAAAAALLAAMTMFYTGGMYLNDAFDRRFDAREQPYRPIPSGRITAARVFACGFAQLAAGAALVALVARSRGHWLPAASGALALGGTIVLYDVWHKGNPLGPVLMGLCRALVYVTSSLALAGRAPSAVLLGAVVLFGYLNVLTSVAKRRGVPGMVVARFIAGISAVDALAIALSGHLLFALLALLGLPLTLLGQRYVRGT